HPAAEVVYAAKHAQHLGWLELFGGYDLLRHGPVAGATKTYRPHDSYPRQLADRTQKGRWEYYTEVTGAPCVLPDRQPIRREAREWARPYAGRVALAPWSSWKDRTWPLSHWLDLERLLLARGFGVVILDDQPNRSNCFHSDKIVLQ